MFAVSMPTQIQIFGNVSSQIYEDNTVISGCLAKTIVKYSYT